MAHYLLFISMVVDTTWLCSAYMFDRMSLIRREETINCGWSARCLKIMTSLILVLNPWMKTRYGYHFCMYYLINKLIHFILLLLPLLNQLIPGTNEITFYYSYCKLYWRCFSDTLNTAYILQWLSTLDIINSVMTTSTWWSIVGFDPRTSTHEWVYINIALGAHCVVICSQCTLYMDNYVQTEKI